MVDLYSRLSKDGERIICGLRDCGTMMALILDPNPLLLEKEIFPWFPPGWFVQRDGVWEVTKRAKRRLRKGRSAQAVSWFMNVQADDVVGLVPIAWPIEARCPACGWRQTLDPTLLGFKKRRRLINGPPYYRRPLYPQERETYDKRLLRLQ